MIRRIPKIAQISLGYGLLCLFTLAAACCWRKSLLSCGEEELQRLLKARAEGSQPRYSYKIIPPYTLPIEVILTFGPLDALAIGVPPIQDEDCIVVFEDGGSFVGFAYAESSDFEPEVWAP